MATTSPLRQRMIGRHDDPQPLAGDAAIIIYAVARFSRHFNSSPDRLGMEEVRAYQLHLVAKNHSWSHINQVACALRFFYGITLGQKEAFERIAGRRRARASGSSPALRSSGSGKAVWSEKFSSVHAQVHKPFQSGAASRRYFDNAVPGGRSWYGVNARHERP